MERIDFSQFRGMFDKRETKDLFSLGYLKFIVKDAPWEELLKRAQVAPRRNAGLGDSEIYSILELLQGLQDARLNYAVSRILQSMGDFAEQFTRKPSLHLTPNESFFKVALEQRESRIDSILRRTESENLCTENELCAVMPFELKDWKNLLELLEISPVDLGVDGKTPRYSLSQIFMAMTLHGLEDLVESIKRYSEITLSAVSWPTGVGFYKPN